MIDKSKKRMAEEVAEIQAKAFRAIMSEAVCLIDLGRIEAAREMLITGGAKNPTKRDLMGRTWKPLTAQEALDGKELSPARQKKVQATQERIGKNRLR